MASGTIYLTPTTPWNTNLEGKVEWSSAYNRFTLLSSVTAKLYVRCTNLTEAILGSWTNQMIIRDDGDVLAAATGDITLSVLDEWVLVRTLTANDILHKYDVSKSIDISASITSPVDSVLNGNRIYINRSAVNLGVISSASTISSAYDVILGNTCKVKWKPFSTSYRYKLMFSIVGWSYTTDAIHPNQTSEYTYTGYTLPIDIATQISDAKTATMTVTLTTYSDSLATKKVGYTSSSIAVTVPSNIDTNPDVTMSLTPISSLGEPFSSLYIQGKTKVKATLSATGKFNANIKSYSVSIGGKTYGSPYESENLATAGTVVVKGRATDSRGYYNEVTKNITVIPYSKPRIKAEAYRCDSNGNKTDSGTYLRISAERSYSPVKLEDIQYNFCQIRYRYKVEGGSYSSWATILASKSLSSNSVVTEALLNGALSALTTYTVQIEAVDDIGENSCTTIAIPAEKIYMHKAGSRGSLGFGEYAEEDDVISIAKDKHVRLKSSINNVRMYGKALSGVSAFDIGTYFSDFAGSGSERQTFFLFGEASGKIIYGVAMVSNNGMTLWDGTTGVTLTTKNEGVLTVTLPAVTNDIFTIISSRDFSV